MALLRLCVCNMELEEFIKTSLKSIYAGVKGANKELLAEKYGVDKSPYWLHAASWSDGKNKGDGFISFDIAVSVTKGRKTSGGGKIEIRVASFGGEAEGTAAESHLSRIKFQVAVSTTTG